MSGTSNPKYYEFQINTDDLSLVYDSYIITITGTFSNGFTTT
jgi:hypothetical protein